MKKKTLLTTICAFSMFFAGAAYADEDDRGGFRANLSGAQEVPEVITDGKGRVRVKFDRRYTRVTVDVDVRNLTGSVVGAHFHCARPAANGPVALGLIAPGPLTFDGRRIRGTLTNADFSGADCVPTTGRPITNVAALAFAMRDGLIYLNVHTDAFRSGEVRGQLQ